MGLTATAAAGSAHPGTARIGRQAVELEGVFLATLVKEMFSSSDSRSEFGGGFAEETRRGLQAEEMANAMAKAGGIGLADQLVTDLLAVQEAAGRKGA